jgi:hypothetical protein
MIASVQEMRAKCGSEAESQGPWRALREASSASRLLQHAERERGHPKRESSRVPTGGKIVQFIGGSERTRPSPPSQAQPRPGTAAAPSLRAIRTAHLHGVNRYAVSGNLVVIARSYRPEQGRQTPEGKRETARVRPPHRFRHEYRPTRPRIKVQHAAPPAPSSSSASTRKARAESFSRGQACAGADPRHDAYAIRRGGASRPSAPRSSTGPLSGSLW